MVENQKSHDEAALNALQKQLEDVVTPDILEQEQNPPDSLLVPPPADHFGTAQQKDEFSKLWDLFQNSFQRSEERLHAGRDGYKDFVYALCSILLVLNAFVVFWLLLGRVPSDNSTKLLSVFVSTTLQGIFWIIGGVGAFYMFKGTQFRPKHIKQIAGELVKERVKKKNR
ncbi:MAG TPA: hypothetical protein VFO10_03130 [Oligoflexus sp.]|uniref:hypothetical protein n=1 Tax=Oligoflexus sp. TaxID=1971216 RepID=UPI002D80FACC|nr:hypothetical protein [Oligoflexus sp.]HET9236217.1 hypothetical protein [Oligoflexus sp.]